MGRGSCALDAAGMATCRCEKGYEGESCERTTCPNDCHHHGTCGVDGVCTCDDTHAGTDCSEERCPKDCSGHGECTTTGTTANSTAAALVCDCAMGWLGSACSERVACPDDCSGHGDCMVKADSFNTLQPTCLCHGDWHGAVCEKKRCLRGVNTLSCSGHGMCGDGGTCACDNMFEGMACEQHDCTLSLDGTVECSGHGTCQDAHCVCDQGYTDSACSIKACPLFEGNLCGNHGVCDPDGTCSCLAGYSGEACHLAAAKPATTATTDATTQRPNATQATQTTAAPPMLPTGKASPIDVENLNEAKEALVAAVASGKNDDIARDVRVMVQDAAIVGAATAPVVTGEENLRFRGIGSRVKHMAKKHVKETKKTLNSLNSRTTNQQDDTTEVQQDTAQIQRVAQTHPEDIEAVASELVLKVETMKQKDLLVNKQVQDLKEKEAAVPTPAVVVSKETLENQVAAAQEAYAYAKAVGGANQTAVAALQVRLTSAQHSLQELVKKIPARNVGKTNGTANGTTNGTRVNQGNCVNDCSGHGTCSAVGVCTCEPAFTGEDCSYELCASCLHGMCHDDVCVCQTDTTTTLPMFFGDSCQLRECPNVLVKTTVATNGTYEKTTTRVPCGGHGTCLSTGDALNDAACDCDDGYSGVGCSIANAVAQKKAQKAQKKAQKAHKQDGDSIVACNRDCTATCDERSKGDGALYLQCFQSCSQRCTGVRLVPPTTAAAASAEEEAASTEEEATADKPEESLNMNTRNVAVVPDTIQPATALDNTQRMHTLITEAQEQTLGEVNLPEKGRNANATKENAVRVFLRVVKD